MGERSLARRIGVALLACLALVVLFKIEGRVNVSFESSTEDWSDSEVLFKGRDFPLIEQQFQSFQAACGMPHASLVRTTAVVWYNLFAWPSYLMDPKWKVPYRDARLPSYQRSPCST